MEVLEEIPPKEKAYLRKHLEQCPFCREEKDRLVKIISLARQTYATSGAPPPPQPGGL